MLIGLVLASAIQLLTGYFTETNRKPVQGDRRELADRRRPRSSCPASRLGLESAVYSALLIGAAVYGGFLLGTGNATLALFAVALAGTGLLTTVGVIVSMDSFGPVTDNAQGIAEMSGDVEGDGRPDPHPAGRGRQHHQGHHQGHRDRDRGARRHGAVRLVPHHRRGRAGQGRRARSACRWTGPTSCVGVIVGAAVVFLFASLLIRAVGRAAQQVVVEVRNQFRDHPGIMDYTEKPEYGRVVDICTRDSLRELATPGLLAVLTPIAVGFAFGYAPLGAYLAGAIAAGVLMAVFLANSGGAWDNAKKLVEDGQLRRQGLRGARGDRHRRHRRRPVQGHRRPGHQPADQGDEPGLAADRHQRGQVQPQHRPAGRRGARRGAIVVAAIVISKRRSASLSGSGAGDGAAAGGAQGPDGAEAAAAVPGSAAEGAEEQTPQATG